MPASVTQSKRRLRGTVVSDKMDKTVVVRVTRVTTHPKYGKQLQVSRRYHAHDEQNTYHVGEQVMIEATRPRSARKRWQVVGRV